MLDFAQLSFIDSTGLAVLVQARQRPLAKHGRLVVRAVPDRVRRVLEITDLLETFDVPPKNESQQPLAEVDLRDVPSPRAQEKG